MAGLVAGTALGLFFSPKKGAELRKNVKEELEEGGTGLKTLKDIFAKWGKDISDTAKECYNDVNENEEFQAKKKLAVKEFQATKKQAVKMVNDIANKAMAPKTKKKAKKVVAKAKKKVTQAATVVKDASMDGMAKVKKVAKKGKKVIKQVQKSVEAKLAAEPKKKLKK